MTAAAALLALTLAVAQAEPVNEPAAKPYQGLKLRSIGPAVTSGRIAALAVHPKDRQVYYAAVASGGVWKTVNAGTTWTPLFDDQGSYSIGAIALDPANPDTVWVGSGENNSQRSVGYGDGLYRSDDGGKSWTNVGLKDSEHIARILIHPKDSRIVYVAAQGPLWGPGGDRGLYRTSDGGKSWKKVLEISENTGVTDVVMDPRNPDVLIAAAYQRRRHVWTLINGGPESALYKSTDGGASWKKLKSGLPSTDLGRIGLALAPSDPDIVYATVESIDGKGGIFRSTDLGESWEKRNDFDQQAQYYGHLVVDPKDKQRIYVMNVVIRISDDGGKTLRRMSERFKHVDNHCLWIDPRDASYYLVGCDGGLYESFDRGATWKFVSNLPVTQFYDISVEQGSPFYHVYGGTQDNFTLGAPARTRSVHGITNNDWFVVQDGDGFHSKIDPKDPNIVYAESQYGVLVRFDRRTGQKVGIQPQPGKGEPPLRWNWSSPLLLSPHSNTRLYFGANRLFRSDDRGDSWKAISGDLTRQLDRDALPVMGKVWGSDAVAKHLSTSFYGNTTAIAESPLKEGRLYVGTDDGLIQVTDDAGQRWRKEEKFPGVPERAYVSRVVASQHDADTVYVAFDNHKMADFAPYLLKSSDAGKSWTSLAANLPKRGSVKAIAEDHRDARLLFVGTEFGLYFTTDGGKQWRRLKGGLPTISVKDLAIQKDQNDLVVGTFGRGIYILDDYAPLRHLEGAAAPIVHYPVREALLYVPTRQYGLPGKAFLGDAFFTAENPPFGAVFTYRLEEGLKTLREQRRDREAKLLKEGKSPPKPTPEEMRAEADEESPAVVLTVRDEQGEVVRSIVGPASAGFHRVNWDLRLPAPVLVRPRSAEAAEDSFAEEPAGPFVLPGSYQVSLSLRIGGKLTPVEGSRRFSVRADGTEKLAEADLKELLEFQGRVNRLQRAVAGTIRAADDLAGRLTQLRDALDVTPGVEPASKKSVRDVLDRLRQLQRVLSGDRVLRRRNENTPPSVVERVDYVVEATRFALARPTRTQRDGYRIAGEEFAEVLTGLRKLIDEDVKKLEDLAEKAGAPWTPGRLPDWKEK